MNERERWLVPLLVAAVVLVMLAVTAWVALRADGGAEPQAGRATPRPTTSASASGPTAGVAPTPAPATVTLEEGVVPGRRFSTAQPPTTVTSVDGPSVDDAVAAFVDTAGWVLTSEDARADPNLVRAELPSLDLMSAGMLQVVEPGAEAVVDFTPGAYTTYGHSGDAAAPAMVMLDTLVVVTVDGSARWLKIGGVMMRTATGWTPSTMQPTELPQPDDVSTPLAEMAPAQVQRVMGDTSLGWKSFAATGR